MARLGIYTARPSKNELFHAAVAGERVGTRRGIASSYRKRIHDVRMSLYNKHKQVVPVEMSLHTDSR